MGASTLRQLLERGELGDYRRPGQLDVLPVLHLDGPDLGGSIPRRGWRESNPSSAALRRHFTHLGHPSFPASED